MSTQNTVTVLESRGVIEARKLKPKIESAKRLMIEAAIEIGSRYRELDDHNKADFRAELGLKLSTAQFYALVSERYTDRASLLESNTSSIPLDKTLSFAIEISRMSDEMFLQVAASGAVTLASTSREARRAVAAVSPLKSKIAAATKAINLAARQINAVRTLMDKERVTVLRGPEIRRLREEFQLLCAELMAADPDMVEQARKVLKGAA